LAKDIYHNIVREALQKDGWIITHDPFVLLAGGVRMEIDIAAEQVFAAQRGVEKIVVEVKSFLNKSKLYDFYEAKGQYDLYRRGLKKDVEQRILFLAVEEEIFNSFFQKPLIKETIEEEHIAIIVFNQHQKNISQWIK
jgi:hypothetical protein